jgi:hypothetical protein
MLRCCSLYTDCKATPSMQRSAFIKGASCDLNMHKAMTDKILENAEDPDSIALSGIHSDVPMDSL